MFRHKYIGLCLKVKLGVSGCDDAHDIELVSDGAVAPSDPAWVLFDFYDNNPQLCEAYFIIDNEYDLSPIKEKYGDESRGRIPGAVVSKHPNINTIGIYCRIF